MQEIAGEQRTGMRVIRAFRSLNDSLHFQLINPRSTNYMRVWVLFTMLVAAILHVTVILHTTGALWDIESFRLQAAAVFHGQNVYVAPGLALRYPYPPVWIWIIAAMQWLSWTVHLPFEWCAKLPALTGDVLLCGLMFGYMRQRFGNSLAALIPAVLYAINPLAILISAGHGQFDALVLMFMVLAIYLRGPEDDRNLMWSSLALGTAIALKGYPVLALPYFVLSAPAGKRALTGVVAFMPLVASLLIYGGLFGFASEMITHVVGYTSTFDFGWLALHTERVEAVFSHPWVAFACRAGLVCFACIVPPLTFRRQPASGLAVIFLAFYATTPTMSVQYIIWVVPFLTLALPVAAVLYSVIGFAGAIAYYTYFPGAIPSFAPWPAVAATLFPIRPLFVILLIAVSIVLAPYLILLRARSKSANLPVSPEVLFEPRAPQLVARGESDR